MTTEQLLEALAKAASERDEIDAAAQAAEDREKELIADAWRQGVHPQRMVEATGRSLAYVRKLRPEDVPPLRTGGGYALKNPPKRTRSAKRK